METTAAFAPAGAPTGAHRHVGAAEAANGGAEIDVADGNDGRIRACRRSYGEIAAV